MKKLKKAIMPILCGTLIFSASITKTEDTKDFLGMAGIIGGIVTIMWGALDLNNITVRTFLDGQRSPGQTFGPYFKAQPTVGAIKIALGAIATAFGSKYFFDKIFGVNQDKKNMNVKIDNIKLEIFINKTAKKTAKEIKENIQQEL